ncbi:MAG: acylneuraminate cytidylyltransferase family protein [Oscillospiraceae bacterium]
MKKMLISIAGRAGSKGFRNKNLKTFCGKPLVYYSLSAANMFIEENSDINVDICLNTDSEHLISMVQEKYPEVEIVERPEELGGDRVSKMSVHQYTIAEMQKRKGIEYDYFMDLDITSPLRTMKDVQNSYELMRKRPDLDIIFSSTQARRNPYFNMVKPVGDHIEIVNESTFTARQQAPEMYDVNASVYMFKPSFLLTNKSGLVWDGKIGITVMMDTGILDIDSEEDFLLMEVIANHLYEQYPEFAKIRNNIR